MKPTKRKGFNFLRSYFDVLNALKKDKDRLSFLMAVINKQFLDEDPKDLDFIPKLSYESQRHSIEQSVKGYKDRMKTDVFGNPLQHPPQGGGEAPPQQEEEKGEEQEKGKEKRTIEYRKREFYNSLTPYVSEFGKERVRDFYEYWSEHGERDRKFRKEKEKSFSIERRLKTWKKREKNFAPKKEKRSAAEILREKLANGQNS